MPRSTFLRISKNVPKNIKKLKEKDHFVDKREMREKPELRGSYAYAERVTCRHSLVKNV